MGLCGTHDLAAFVAARAFIWRIDRLLFLIVFLRRGLRKGLHNRRGLTSVYVMPPVALIRSINSAGLTGEK